MLQEQVLDSKTARLINKDFVIRVYPDSADTHTNHLCGLPKLKKLIADDKLFQKIIEKVLNSPNQKEEFKFRRGLRKGDKPGIRITFASR